MSLGKSDQEKFLVGKMVARVKELHQENGVFERKLNEKDLSDSDYDLYQGLMDKNIGEQQAYRRMEDNLRQWREDHVPPVIETPAFCQVSVDGKGCQKVKNHMGAHIV